MNQEPKMPDLLPCPFCGAPAKFWQWNTGARVECTNWGKNDHFVGIGGRTLDEAVRLWNERKSGTEKEAR